MKLGQCLCLEPGAFSHRIALAAPKAKRTTQIAELIAATELAMKLCERSEVGRLAIREKQEKLCTENKGLTPEIRGHYCGLGQVREWPRNWPGPQ